MYLKFKADDLKGTRVACKIKLQSKILHSNVRIKLKAVVHIEYAYKCIFKWSFLILHKICILEAHKNLVLVKKSV